MKKVLIFLILVIILILLLISLFFTDKIDKRQVNIVNKTDDTIFCFNAIHHAFDNVYNMYKDYDFDRKFMVVGDSSSVFYDHPRDWNTAFNYSLDGKLRFFIISKDSVNKYGWEKVSKDTIFTKVYLLDIHDLDSLNWTIVYDGK